MRGEAVEGDAVDADSVASTDDHDIVFLIGVRRIMMEKCQERDPCINCNLNHIIHTAVPSAALLRVFLTVIRTVGDQEVRTRGKSRQARIDALRHISDILRRVVRVAATCSRRGSFPAQRGSLERYSGHGDFAWWEV
ncbi:MAG: hypothetical protein COZ70_01340, partial [Deltaproteobacteria bacterium CG_4_8_14_3_um_filter_51_11]